MSNRRRPQRRDAHGAPVRTRREIWIAIATGAGVLIVTVLLIVWLQNEDPSAPAVSTSSTIAPASSTTASTTASTPTSSTTASTTSTTTP